MDLTNYIDSFVEENYGEVSISDTAYHFFNLGKKNAEEHMMKDAIDTTIKQGSTDIGIFIKGLDENKFSFGDKVKVIIIKEE